MSEAEVVATDAKPATTTVEIRHWLRGTILFSCEVDAGLSLGLRLGAAVKLAFEAGASLDGARLVGASLVGASLVGASLDGARLVGASLDGARLDGARLDGASLDGASLVGASLVGASLDGARLVGASLDGARLDGASLDGARLASMSGALDFGTPHGWRIVVVRHDDGIRIAAGCRWMTFSAAVEYWKDQGGRKPLSGPLLAYIKAAVEIKGWTL